MTICPLYIAPSRPALAPILFPDTKDGLCSARYDAHRMGGRIIHGDSALPYHLARVLGDFERRLNARIAQVAK